MHPFRSLVRNPLFTGAAVLTVALGIGASVTVFTIVNAVLLRPLPFPEADRLVVLKYAAPGFGGRRGGISERISGPLYFLYADESRALDGVTAIQMGSASFTDAENPQRVLTSDVTASFLDMLRTPPRIGRAFSQRDEREDAEPVVLLSDALWRTRFGADPDVVGRLVDVDGSRTEVVGVMPPGFTFLWPNIDLWRPLRLDRETVQLGNFFHMGVARVADGFTLEQAEAELGAMLSDLRAVFPDQYAAPTLAEAGFRPVIVPAREHLVGDIGATLWILLAAVGFLLLIACANVANLFLVKSDARYNEFAIRFALGARRGHLAGSVFLESMALGLAGGLVSVPISLLAVRLLVRWGPRELPRLQEISVDSSVLVFGVAVSVLAGLLVGLLPAWRTTAVAASAGLTAGARSATDGRKRLSARRGLVTAQIALALVLLIGAGLAARSFQKLVAVDPGFDPVDALTFSVALPERTYEPAARLSFQRALLERLRGLPGVVGGAATNGIPLAFFPRASDHRFERGALAKLDVPRVLRWKQIAPGYFDAMRIDFLEGRDFDPLDEERGERAVIVSRSFARQAWPGGNALGQGVRSGGMPRVDGDGWFRVIGVVDDVHEIGLHIDPPPMAYYPQVVRTTRDDETSTSIMPAMRYVVRASNAAGLAGGVRDAVRELDATLPVSDVDTLEAVVARARQQRAFVMVLIVVAAVLALLLGTVGLYGVVSYTVARRRREIAIRMAVGAQVSDVRRLVLLEAGGLAGIGTALGIGAALALTRQLQAILFETSPLDPAVFGGVSALLVSICLLASWMPARRATRVQPMSALRVE